MKMLNSFAPLLAASSPPELGPGPRAGRQPLQPLQAAIDTAVAQHSFPTPTRDAIRALILLYHDHHDAAHGIVQDMGTVEASYVHAILHRREPDYGNAKYWFHRVGRHASYGTLAECAGVLLDEAKATSLKARLLARGAWDAFAFVAACEEGRDEELLRAIQVAEFHVLLVFLADSAA